MQIDKQQFWKINQLFILLVAISILFATMKSSSSLLVPLLIASAMAILLSPLFSYLETKHVPKSVSLVFLALLILLPIVTFGDYLGGEVKEFAQNYDSMQKEFET